MEDKKIVENNLTISGDPDDSELPLCMKRATHRMTKFRANHHDKHNYRRMVQRCDHLDEDQRPTLMQLFTRFKELFSGKLGRIPRPPVRLKLKKDTT